jgi:hypothetical protein
MVAEPGADVGIWLLTCGLTSLSGSGRMPPGLSIMSGWHWLRAALCGRPC